MLEMFFSVEGMLSLLTLTILEVVLGIDNILFISIICDKLPKEQQGRARTLGLMLALLVRVGLLMTIDWIKSLDEYIIFSFDFIKDWGVHVHDYNFSPKDAILLVGGLFLMAKSVSEIHAKISHEEEGGEAPKSSSFMGAVAMIVWIDIIFSFDSILTAVGVVEQLPIMIVAVILGISLMLIFSKAISDYINSKPTIKVLALAFLVLIGFLLLAESFGVEVPKGYIYFAMGFAFLVEMLNIKMRGNKKKKRTSVKQEA